MSFSPQWAIPTNHPYAQYYDDARYPGNSVFATTGSLIPEKYVWPARIVAMLALAGIGYYSTRKAKMSTRVLTASACAGIVLLEALLTSWRPKASM